jgi:2-keto-4-pentenoate hydratase/2-oxohepta-3-ene-1,7-dioic acid hydratase in catechol pathway
MKLARFTTEGTTRIGKVVGDQIVDLCAACPSIPNDMISLLSAGARALLLVEQVQDGPAIYPLSHVHLEAPIPNPSKYLAIGLNYRSHLEEVSQVGVRSFDSQIWFNKQTSCICGPYDPIHMPLVSKQLDWEVELCVVIGARCRHVQVDQAPEVIAGYMVANDVSVRDWQMMTPTWTLGKSFDTHGPIGPWLVTTDEIRDPHNLALRLTVNGIERQNSSTRLMIRNVYQQIAHLTEVMTLVPGDLLATGTPEGVGFTMKPPMFLRVGDVVRAEVERIGYIESRVMPEPR